MTNYSGKRWREARSIAVARDKGQCQDCGATENLHAHHIIPVKDFGSEKDAHYPANLVMLCKYCHPKWEGKNTRPVLLDSPSNTRLDSVVTELSTDTVVRESIAAATGGIYVNWVRTDPTICDWCFRRKSSKGWSKKERYAQYIRALHAADASPPPPDYGKDSNICGGCENTLPSETRTVEKALEHGGALYNRLCEMGVPVEKKIFFDVIENRKRDPEVTLWDHGAFVTAVECAVHLAVGRETKNYHTPPHIYMDPL